jgi:hypothetical protein
MPVDPNAYLAAGPKAEKPFEPDEWLATHPGRKADDTFVLPSDRDASRTAPDTNPPPPGFKLDPQAPTDNLPNAPWAILEAKRKSAIQTAAEIALIPPVLVLAFGVALGWAVKGFWD